ncbi:MAG: beta-ketoacyl-[acyl-carrier-protein] synthase family protein [Planctomycetaceae bacterium]
MKAGTTAEQAVITGVGVVSPIGIGNETFWQNLLRGKSGIDYLRNFPNSNLPIKLAAEIRDFDPERFIDHRKLIKVMSRDIQLGVSAAALAMKDARLRDGDVEPERLGVEFGAGRISTTPQDLLEAVKQCSSSESFQYTRWGEDTMGEIAPLWMLRHLPNMPACHVSIQHNARGPNNTITSRDASALLALGEAVSAIERGAADCMIVGACGSNIQPVDIAKLSLYEGLSRRDDDPHRACRPFDINRDGTIVGEGAAAFIVEGKRHAVRRGVDIYAEILSVGAGCDGRGYANGAGGTGLVRAMRSAIRRAGIEPRELGHINAHGKSTQRDDLVEARAYHRAFGAEAERIPVTALKSYFGHFDAGSGAVELAGSVLALKHRMVPATLNYEIPDPRCRLNVVHDGPIQQRSSTAITVNRTAMGQSAAAVIRAV